MIPAILRPYHASCSVRSINIAVGRCGLSSFSRECQHQSSKLTMTRGWTGVARRVVGGYDDAITQARTYSSTNVYQMNPLDQFRDPVDRQTRATEKVGRSWSAKELRRKSYDDLHRLWYVLYKERNMLLTEQQLSRRRQLVFPQPDRLYKVQKSMGAIRQVLGERKRVKVAAHLASQMEKSMLAESDTLEQHEVDVPKPE